MTEQPNIVLVTVDSLRADHCGFMGYERNTTPTLDAMASEGIVFENAIAPGPSTPESMPVIFTGQYPVEREEEKNANSELERRRTRIKAHMEARDTLPEKLKRMGYNTAAFTPNPFTSRHFGFNQGFDHFQDFMDKSDRSRLYDTVFQGFLNGRSVSSLARVFMNFWQREEVFKPWESYYDEILEWVRGTEEPYFLWIFLMDVHNPYMSSDEYRTQSKWKEFHANFEFWRQSHETPFSDTVHDRLVTAYDDSIRYADAFLERLWSDLADDIPVFVVHGDHGEAFGEHGTYGHEPYLHEENMHVPLISANTTYKQLQQDPVSLIRLNDLIVQSMHEENDRSQCQTILTQTQTGSIALLAQDGVQYMSNNEISGDREPDNRKIPPYRGEKNIRQIHQDLVRIHRCSEQEKKHIQNISVSMGVEKL